MEANQSARKNQYMNRMVRDLLGSGYSWCDELYFFGNPLVAGATERENAIVSKIERNWEQAIRV